MIINNTEYGFIISPAFGKVIAEIYKVSDVTFLDGKKMQIRILDKEFGSMFRTPNESDYKKAREWADLQMKCILDANT